MRQQAVSKSAQFEDLIAWQKARVLTQRIYTMTAESLFSRDFGLCDQIRRAAVSIMSNITEGYERGSDGDFARFLGIAKASCAEVRSQLYVALDVGYIDADMFRDLHAQTLELSRIISGLKTSVERRKT